MQICRFWEPKLGPRLGLVFGEEVVDLTGIDPVGCGDVSAWLRLKDPLLHMNRLAELAARRRTRILMRELDRKPGPAHRHLLAPLDAQEVWGAGVTYERSRTARMEESRVGGKFYDEVYDADRPELFLKATPHRTSGPNAPIRVRSDSEWTVPEPELALVLSPSLKIVGYTCGNDISSRDIEGENPLYLPQAKTYLECCALGPVITLATDTLDPANLTVNLVVIRDGMTVFHDETTTNRMKRTMPNLVSYLGRDNAFPEGVFLITGTGIVPPDEFKLEPDDIVEITIEGIGTLRNPVVQGSPEEIGTHSSAVSP
jgi:2-dehydro-3-deoxy-D-arabinonate dehydratase